MSIKDKINKEFKKNEGDQKKIIDVTTAIKEISKWIHLGDENRIKIFEIGEKNNIRRSPLSTPELNSAENSWSEDFLRRTAYKKSRTTYFLH